MGFHGGSHALHGLCKALVAQAGARAGSRTCGWRVAGWGFMEAVVHVQQGLCKARVFEADVLGQRCLGPHQPQHLQALR